MSFLPPLQFASADNGHQAVGDTGGANVLNYNPASRGVPWWIVAAGAVGLLVLIAGRR